MAEPLIMAEPLTPEPRHGDRPEAAKQPKDLRELQPEDMEPVTGGDQDIDTAGTEADDSMPPKADATGF